MTLSGPQDCRYSVHPSRSRASNSSSDSWILAAATFSSRCAILDVPGMGSMTGLRLSTHASAIWLGAVYACQKQTRFNTRLAPLYLHRLVQAMTCHMSFPVRWSCAGRVIATGALSEIGKIGQPLATLETEPPRLHAQMRRLVRMFAVVGGAVSVLAVLLYGALRGGWLDALLAGIALGMSMLPEEIPVALTVFMAMGAWRISRARVLFGAPQLSKRSVRRWCFVQTRPARWLTDH